MKWTCLLLAPLLVGAMECKAADADTLTLEACIRIGMENNIGLKKRTEEVRVSKIGLSENRARLLPVIQGFGNFVNNVHRGTSLSDGSNMGRLLGVDAPYMASQGLRYTTTGGIQLSLPLYDQTLYTGTEVAKKMVSISQASYEKAKEDLTIEIGKLYYLAQTTEEQIKLTQKNIGRLEELLGITQALYENDMALQVNVQRVEINLKTLQVKLDNAKAMLEQQFNLLRYMLDLSPETSIVLETIEVNDTFDDDHLLGGVSSSLYELQLLDLQAELIKKQKKAINHAYLPSLSLVGNLSYTAFTDHFENYFHNHPTNRWYNTTSWGLSLKVPIFDGMAKYHKRQKANAQYNTLQLTIEDTRRNLQTQYGNAMNNWYNSVRTVQQQTDNYRLAENVYLVTTDQYKEGVASMSDLLQDEMRMSEAQNGYVSALYNYKVSELALLKLTGQLNLLTEKQTSN